MKKIVAIAAGLVFATVLAVQAADKPAKSPPTPEQKAARKEMMQKYDADSDKKLSADEIAKITADDKEKYEKAGVMPKMGKKKNK